MNPTNRLYSSFVFYCLFVLSVTEISYFLGPNLISLWCNDKICLYYCTVWDYYCARSQLLHRKWMSLGSPCWSAWGEEDAGGSAGSWLLWGEELSVCTDITGLHTSSSIDLQGKKANKEGQEWWGKSTLWISEIHEVQSLWTKETYAECCCHGPEAAAVQCCYYWPKLHCAVHVPKSLANDLLLWSCVSRSSLYFIQVNQKDKQEVWRC